MELKQRSSRKAFKSSILYLQLLPILQYFGPRPFQRHCSKVDGRTFRNWAASSVLRFGDDAGEGVILVCSGMVVFL